MTVHNQMPQQNMYAAPVQPMAQMGGYPPPNYAMQEMPPANSQNYGRPKVQNQNRQDMQKRRDFMILQVVLDTEDVYSFNAIFDTKIQADNISKIESRKKEMYTIAI